MVKALALLALLTGGCLRKVEYNCASDEFCVSSGINGTCESTGFCSFADTTCPGGRRYGDVGPLAGVCVGDEPPVDGPIADTPVIDPDAPRGPPPSGAVMWLKLDDDPNDGVADSAGTHIGTCSTACPTQIVGAPHGSGYGFTNQQVSVIAASDLVPGAGFTVAAWARIETSPTDSYGNILCKQFGTGDNSYCVAVRQTTRFADFYTEQLNDLQGTTAISLAVWHHFAMTWDGAIKRGYVDGVLIGMKAEAAVGSDAMPFHLGATFSPAANTIDGAIDDVFFYNRVLTDAEVVQLMNHED